MQTTMIGFDYYDGFIEGVSFSKSGSKIFYFKILAWDKKQDQRLYFLCKAKKSDFDDMLNVLFEDRDGREFDSWLIKYSFDGSSKGMFLSEKIDQFQSISPSYFVLGKSIDDELSMRYDIGDNVKEKVKGALISENIDDLAVWLPFLKQKLN